MSQPLRPIHTFVLRVWHEPGDTNNNAKWRGFIRRLESPNMPGEKQHFLGLEEDLGNQLRLLLTDSESAPQSEH